MNNQVLADRVGLTGDLALHHRELDEIGGHSVAAAHEADEFGAALECRRPAVGVMGVKKRQANKMCGDGVSVSEIAEVLGVARSVLYRNLQ